MFREIVTSKKIRFRPGARAIFVLTIILAVGAFVAGWWSKEKTNQPASLSPNNPSKEYIYAGQRLVAIEESGGGGTSPIPGNLEAEGGGTQIIVQWSAASGAAHYQVERASVAGEFSIVFGNVASTSVTDNVAADAAYLYRVRAVDAAGNLSPPSNIDLATSVVFSDDPLQGTAAGTGTTIKAAHLVELRRAVNAVRLLSGLAPSSWSYPDPSSEPSGQRSIYLADMLELRSGLDEALNLLGLPHSYETDPNLSGGFVKAAHFQELRERVK